MRNLENLSENEVSELNDVVMALFKNEYIAKNRIEPSTGYIKSDPRYEKCMILENQVRSYLGVMGIKLIHDANMRIYYIRSEESNNRSMLSEETTYILFVLRVIYDEQMRQAAKSKVVTNKLEIRNRGMDTGLITSKLTQDAWKKALSLLKRKNIITFPGDVSSMDDRTPIYITDAIAIAMGTDRINRITEMMMQKKTIKTEMEIEAA